MNILITNESRDNVWKRWKSYVKNNPNKYRIKCKFLKATHQVSLQEKFFISKDLLARDEEKIKWIDIEKLPKWVFELQCEIGIDR